MIYGEKCCICGDMVEDEDVYTLEELNFCQWCWINDVLKIIKKLCSLRENEQ